MSYITTIKMRKEIRMLNLNIKMTYSYTYSTSRAVLSVKSFDNNVDVTWWQLSVEPTFSTFQGLDPTVCLIFSEFMI